MDKLFSMVCSQAFSLLKGRASLAALKGSSQAFSLLKGSSCLSALKGSSHLMVLKGYFFSEFPLSSPFASALLFSLLQQALYPLARYGGRSTL